MQDQTEYDPETKVCASCGGSFACGAKLEGCWCVDIELPSEIADSLKASYDDCLCQKCLASLAEINQPK